MQMETEQSLRDERSFDAAFERLRRDLIAAPAERVASPSMTEGPEAIDYASLEMEVGRMRKRIAIWEIFMSYIRDGARSWPEVQRSLTKADFTKIVSICDGVPLRDLLLDMQ
jgi:hypothetical protein